MLQKNQARTSCFAAAWTKTKYLQKDVAFSGGAEPDLTVIVIRDYSAGLPGSGPEPQGVRRAPDLI